MNRCSIQSERRHTKSTSALALAITTLLFSSSCASKYPNFSLPPLRIGPLGSINRGLSDLLECSISSGISAYLVSEKMQTCELDSLGPYESPVPVTFDYLECRAMIPQLERVKSELVFFSSDDAGNEREFPLPEFANFRSCVCSELAEEPPGSSDLSKCEPMQYVAVYRNDNDRTRRVEFQTAPCEEDSGKICVQVVSVYPQK